MTHSTNSTSENQNFSLAKRMFVGAGFGLLLISLFVLPIRDPDPAWGKLWMVRPMIIVSLAGAMGGLCNHYIIDFHKQAGVNKTVAIVLSVIVYIIGLWLGAVLGLDGTLFD